MSCVYNKNLILQIINPGGSFEEKNLNLVIISSQDALTIKIRDPSECSFNYSEIIDLGDYEVMRVKQNLDINFMEFKSNLLEMLAQLQNREMFLRCEISEQLCTLVFFNKSKIKSITYLTVELHTTSQKEILQELMNNLQYVKDSNDRLQLQVSYMKKAIVDKDKEIKHLNIVKTEMERQFYNVIKEIEDNIDMKTREVECLLLRKIKMATQRIITLLIDVHHLRKDTNLKSDSSTKLLKSVEHLKLENSEKDISIERLKKDNSALQATNSNIEKSVASLRHLLIEKEVAIKELQSKNEELRVDMEKATIVIAQKKNTVDELSKDLVQANQMLVNFNHHYDTKVKALENLQATLNNKNQIIEEERRQYYELQKQFDEYRAVFNEENQERIKHDLLLSRNKIEELEQSIRKANKINALLSEKVNKITR